MVKSLNCKGSMHQYFIMSAKKLSDIDILFVEYSK